LAKPQKFINPCQDYRLYYDTFIRESDHTIYLDVQIMNTFKLVSSIDINAETHGITINLIDNACSGSSSWKYLVERLFSFNDKNCADFAELIKQFCNNYEQNMKIESQSSQKNQKPLSKPRVKKTYIDQPCIWYSRVRTEGADFSLISVGLNLKMLELLEYSLDQFINMMLTEGLPGYYVTGPVDPVEHRYWFKALTEPFNHPLFKLKNDAALVSSQGKPISVTQESGIQFEIAKDGKEIYKLYSTFPVTNTPFMETPTIHTKESAEFTTYRAEKKNEIKDFLSRYYGLKEENPDDLRRMCRVKLIQ